MKYIILLAAMFILSGCGASHIVTGDSGKPISITESGYTTQGCIDSLQERAKEHDVKLINFRVRGSALETAVLLYYTAGAIKPVSCSADAVQNTGNPTAKPFISNLIFTPAEASINQGGGAITIDGSIDYIDNGNLSGGSIYVEPTETLSNISAPPMIIRLTTAPGSATGTIKTKVAVSTKFPQAVSFNLYVVDSQNNKSNTLTGIFAVK